MGRHKYRLKISALFSMNVSFVGVAVVAAADLVAVIIFSSSSSSSSSIGGERV
jgi:hypothetical protein